MTGNFSVFFAFVKSDFNFDLLFKLQCLNDCSIFDIFPVGLDIETCQIIEMACLITDENLNIVAEVDNYLSGDRPFHQHVVSQTTSSLTFRIDVGVININQIQYIICN